MGVDPTLQLYDIRPLDEGAWQTELLYESWLWVILAAGGIGLLLALAGIYSIMSFTVSRRTREIGVRVALGADRRRIVGAIFSRALTQVGLGVVVGGVIFLGLVFLLSEGSVRPGGRELLITSMYLTVMLGVCLLACIVPARRALGIEPTEALRADG
jgi:ABC-type antimicrobial peptide transport system permease subunit